MARTNKKRTRELQHDRFRDTTVDIFTRLGNRLENRGRTILYILGGVLAAALLAGLLSWWSNRRGNEAQLALGRAIDIQNAQVSASPAPSPTSGPNELTFPSERERAERAVDEFQKVAAKYDDPYRAKARYFMAVNLLTIDRNRGISELESLSQTAKDETRAWSRFALAQAREADGQYDPAITLYGELLKEKAGLVPSNTVKLRLAAILEKQGKRKEASDILFDIAESARKARDSAGKAIPPSSAAREAAQKLESLDPERFAQLTPDPLASGLQL